MLKILSRAAHVFWALHVKYRHVANMITLPSEPLTGMTEDVSLDLISTLLTLTHDKIFQGEDLLNKEDTQLLYLDDSNMDVLGKSHALVYLMYDE